MIVETRYSVWMYYYAYGSNVNKRVLINYLIRYGLAPHNLQPWGRAVLDHYRIRTNYASSYGMGAANIEPAPGRQVEGVLYVIDGSIRQALRRKEGWPGCYQEIEICVLVPGSDKVLKAMTYIVAPKHQLRANQPVTSGYRATILEGASQSHFSSRYVRHLRRVLCVGHGT